MSTILNIPATYYAENNIRYVFIDGNACKHIDKCYVTLQEQLSLPDYFGKNLDALEEVLADLEWIPQEKVRFIIFNQQDLLSHDTEKKNDFLYILNSCENEKVGIVYVGVDGDN